MAYRNRIDIRQSEFLFIHQDIYKNSDQLPSFFDWKLKKAHTLIEELATQYKGVLEELDLWPINVTQITDTERQIAFLMISANRKIACEFTRNEHQRFSIL